VAALLHLLAFSAGGEELDLQRAARDALAANLELAAARRTLAANREEIGVARAALLPQVDLGAKANYLDDERSGEGRGNTTQESVAMAAGLTQVLYDEQAWASFRIQEHVYTAQEAGFDAFELEIVQDAANAFLALDRSREILSVQERNRALTAKNLETSRARIAAGYSSEREVLRWESQLASNDGAVVQARTQVLASRFELNRIRDRPPEDPIAPLPASVEAYGFVYAKPTIAAAIAQAEGDQRMRDYLVRVALARSPNLVAIAAAIEAGERLLTARRRAFWMPSFSFGAAIDHLAVRGNADEDFNETEWKLGVGLNFPLIAGGGKFSQLDQSREELDSLGITRRATAQQIEQTVRAAFAEASGSYASLAFARTQATTARRNLDLVQESYTLGVASILSLLDAQSLLLGAELSESNAHYDFLDDIVAAERAISLYPFLEPATAMQALLDELERELTTRP
jgi:outer membrane protein TolC